MDLLLQSNNGGDATVDRVGEPSLSLVGNGDDGIVAAVGRDVQQELGHIAGTEHLVNRGEPGRALVRPEVRGEYAPADALPPQEFACAAWRVGRRGPFRRLRAPLPGPLPPALGCAVVLSWHIHAEWREGDY